MNKQRCDPVSFWHQHTTYKSHMCGICIQLFQPRHLTVHPFIPSIKPFPGWRCSVSPYIHVLLIFQTGSRDQQKWPKFTYWGSVTVYTIKCSFCVLMCFGGGEMRRIKKNDDILITRRAHHTGCSISFVFETNSKHLCKNTQCQIRLFFVSFFGWDSGVLKLVLYDQWALLWITVNV